MVTTARRTLLCGVHWHARKMAVSGHSKSPRLHQDRSGSLQAGAPWICHGWEVRHCPTMVKSIFGGVRWRLRQRHVSGLSYSTYTLLPPSVNLHHIWIVPRGTGPQPWPLRAPGSQPCPPSGLNKLQLAVEALRGSSYVIKPFL